MNPRSCNWGFESIMVKEKGSGLIPILMFLVETLQCFLNNQVQWILEDLLKGLEEFCSGSAVDDAVVA